MAARRDKDDAQAASYWDAFAWWSSIWIVRTSSDWRFFLRFCVSFIFVLIVFFLNEKHEAARRPAVASPSDSVMFVSEI